MDISLIPFTFSSLLTFHYRPQSETRRRRLDGLLCHFHISR